MAVTGPGRKGSPKKRGGSPSSKCFGGGGKTCRPGKVKRKRAVKAAVTKVKKAVRNVKDDISTVKRNVKKKSTARKVERTDKKIERTDKKIERKTVKRNKKTGTTPVLPTRRPTTVTTKKNTPTLVKRKVRQEEYFSTCKSNKTCSPEQRTIHKNARARAKKAGNSTYYIGNKAYATNYSNSKTATNAEAKRRK